MPVPRKKEIILQQTYRPGAVCHVLNVLVAVPARHASSLVLIGARTTYLGSNERGAAPSSITKYYDPQRLREGMICAVSVVEEARGIEHRLTCAGGRDAH